MAQVLYGQRTYWVNDVDPLLCLTLDELAADEVPGVASGRARSLPLLGDLLSLRSCSRAQTAERGLGCRRGSKRAERANAQLGRTRKLGERHGMMSEVEPVKLASSLSV